MKLISCYVENYGKISKKNYDFKSGFNCIKEDNGAGKSTLASFIKSMFYGVKDNRTAEKENDRANYKPWQGGKFGGNIVFEIGEKKYKIERFFGNTPKDDEFIIYDAVSNTLSSDYGSDIGEKLFSINADGYERSTYVPQNAVEFTGISDDLNLKLNDLINNVGEKQSFKKAIDRLASAEKILQPARKEGKIDNCNKKIRELQQKIELCGSYEKMAEKALEEKTSGEIEIKKIKSQIGQKEQQLQTANTANEQSANKSMYNSLNDNIDKDNAKLEKLKNFFNGETVEKINLEALKDKITKVKEKEKELDDIKKEIDAQETSLNNLNGELNANIAMLDAHKSKERLLKENETTIESTYEHIDIEKRKLEEKLKKAREIEAQPKEQTVKGNGKLIITLAILSGIFLIVGLILTFFILPLGVSILALGVIGLFVAGGIYLKNYIDKKANLQFSPQVEFIDIEAARSEYNEKADEMANNRAAKEQNEEDLKEVEEKIKNNLKEKENIENKILTTKNENELSIEKQEKVSTESDIIITSVNDDFKKFKFSTTEWQEQIVELKNNITTYYETTKQLSEDNKELDKFITGKDETALINSSGLKIDTKKIMEEKKELDSKKEDLQREINKASDNYIEYDNKASEKQALENEKSDIADELKEAENNLKMIKKAIELLNSANERMAQKYLDPLKEECKKLIGQFDTGNFKIIFDKNTNLLIEDSGQNRKLDNYSLGYKELISLCIRFALIKVIFTKEQPYVILDDPFTNLDDKKLSLMKTFIKNISTTYQIIYFTCHESREVR